MGRQGNDPLCPCLMRQAGLTPTPIWTPEKVAEFEEAMRIVVERDTAIDAAQEAKREAGSA